MIKIYKYSEVSKSEIFDRSEAGEDVSAVVSEIIDKVRTGRDCALREYTKRFDGAQIDAIEVTDNEFAEAISEVEPRFMEVLEKAAKNIRRFHEKQLRSGYSIEGENGEIIGQKFMPIERVGLYVPGGTAAYPSTVLMDSIPAKLAGCKDICIVTPPSKNGRINPAILAAAKTAGVDRVFKVGGAQAVAALAYGTETIPRVDKIVGPGNAFVAEAKRQVFGRVSIDMIAGPSEILIVANSDNDPRHLAADMLSQAEHDRRASAVLITDSLGLAEDVSAEIERQLESLLRREIARDSIDNYGKIIVTANIDEAVSIANELAPEHLELCVSEPFAYLEKIKNAGSVFLGRYCPEALGDYLAGPNHTLPTSGTARFSGALSVDDFIKKTQFIYYTKEALGGVYQDVSYFANKEGLTAHARSAEIRFED